MQALKLITAVQDQLKDTLANLDLFADSFEVFYCDPQPLKQSFHYCDEADSSGKLIREGELRSLVLSTPVNNQTAMYCARGPGGMGKTVALQWLCADKQVRDHFKHGVHWFSFGENFESAHLLTQIRECALDCGAMELGDKLANEPDITIAIRKLCDIFASKKVLFVIDDVWNEHRNEILSFRKSLNKGSGCAVVISCRDQDIANACDGMVRFDYLPPNGEVSKDLLLSYVGDDKKDDVLKCENESKKCAIALQRGLEECGGWVLCLSIAGAMLKAELDGCIDAEEASELITGWADSLTEDGDLIIGRTKHYDGCLQRIVVQSLKIVEQKLKKSGLQENVCSSVNEKFKMLCVIQKQKTIPLPVLERLWKLKRYETTRLIETMAEASLVDVVRDKKVGKVVRTHDKIIDLSREQVGDDGDARYHEELLESFLSHCTQINPYGDLPYRPWWDRRVESEYMMQNLGYHLVKARRKKELWGVLSDARFMMRRLDDGTEWVGVEENFNRMIGAGIEVKDGMEKLRSVLGNCWRRISNDRYSLGFHMFGRLEKKEGRSIARFLTSIEQFESGPWLQPLKPYLTPRECKAELPIEVDDLAVPFWISEDLSTIGLVTSVSSPRSLAFLDSELQTLQKILSIKRPMHDCVRFQYQWSYHGNFVLSVGERREELEAIDIYDRCKNANEEVPVSSTASRRWCTSCPVHSVEKLVLGYGDRTLQATCISDDASLSKMPLTTHTGYVLFVAFSASGTRVTSGSGDETVRVYSVEDGTFTEHTHCVSCVAFSAVGARVASGSDNEAVRLWSITEPEPYYPCNVEAIPHQFSFSSDCVDVIVALYDGGLKLSSASPVSLGGEAVEQTHWSVTRSADGGVQVLKRNDYNDTITVATLDRHPSTVESHWGSRHTVDGMEDGGVIICRMHP